MNRIRSVYFSPTNAAKRIATSILRAFENVEIIESNLTSPSDRKIFQPQITEDLVLICMPVYGKYIPRIILRCLNEIIGNGKPVILVAVYGNAHYGASLKELYEISMKRNLYPIALGAFVGEHTISTDELQIAKSRPDLIDQEEARRLGISISDKMRRTYEMICKKDVPGSGPLIFGVIPKKSVHMVTKKPVINDKCIKCNKCINLCPAGAIDENLNIGNKCIRCFSCVKNCPVNGRDIVYKNRWMINIAMRNAISGQKSNLIIL
jgi:ferredoxin